MDADGGCFVGLQGGNFLVDPTDLLSLALWLRADQGTTIATGVSQWNDLSGTGDPNKNVAQVTTTKQPALNASNANYNHQKTIDFDGVDDYLVSGTWRLPLIQPWTTFVVGHNTAGSNNIALDNLAADQASIQSNAGQYQIYAGTTLAGVSGWNVPAVTCSIFNGTTSYRYFNTISVQIPGNAGTNNMQGTTVGGYGAAPGNTTNSWTGSIAEIIIYSRAIISTEAISVMRYLGIRYGIAVTP